MKKSLNEDGGILRWDNDFFLGSTMQEKFTDEKTTIE